MNKYWEIIIGLFLALCLASCEEDIYVESEPQVVVDGWIDAGGYPVIILTETVPVSIHSQRIDELDRYIIRTAKVTVSCDGDSVVLTSKYDKSYYPPYIYTTSRMCGEAGKRYDLTIEYEGKTISASTTIPSVVQIDSVAFEPVKDLSKKVCLKIWFNDDRNSKDYYKVFTNSDVKSRMYLSAYMQTWDDVVLKETNEVAVYRGTSYSNRDYDMYFDGGDDVAIKLCHIDGEIYQFWHDYENSLSFSRNMFLQFTENLSSNIDGGMGCWCGYGASFRWIKVPMME